MFAKSLSGCSLVARITEFATPPVSDALVVGRESPIGHAALYRALELLAPGVYQCIEVKDDVVGHVIVRRNLLARVSEGTLVDFVCSRVKPLLAADEVLNMALTAEVRISESEL